MIDKRTRSKKAKKNEVINLSDNKNDINKKTDCLNKNDIVNNIDNGVVDISNKDNNELSYSKFRISQSDENSESKLKK